MRPIDNVGVTTGDLPTAAQRRVLEIVRTYLANHPGEMARQALARIERAGLARTRFGWAGSTRPGVPHYYRLQVPASCSSSTTRGTAAPTSTASGATSSDFGRHLL